MLPRLEAHGFTKFVLSIGVFLCVGAILVPALILRDTDVLLISEDELAGLTPTSAKEVRSRQQTARNLGRAAPYIGIVLFLGGAALVWYGLPRLRRQEDNEEAKASMERDKLQNELEPQSEEEEQAELVATVQETEAVTATENEAEVPPAQQPLVSSDRFRRAREMEELVLGRLAEIAPPRYELRSRVKVSGAPDLLVDGILVSAVDQLPDILVDIKLGGHGLSQNLRNRVADTLLRLATYRKRLDRPTLGWLIIVLDERLPAKRKEDLIHRISDLADEIRLTVIEADQIQNLVLPAG